MRRKGLGPLLSITVVAVVMLTSVLVAGYRPFLGLDLQGGISVVLQPKTDGQTAAITDEALDDTIAVIRSRIDTVGVAEPEITRQGNNVVVDIPGVKDQKQAQDLIRQTGELRFRPVLGGYAAPPEGESTTGTTLPASTGTTIGGGGDVPATTPTTSPTTMPPSSTTAVPSFEAIDPGADEQGMGLSIGESAAGRQSLPVAVDGAPSTTLAPVAPEVAVAPDGDLGPGDTLPPDVTPEVTSAPIDISELPPETLEGLGLDPSMSQAPTGDLSPTPADQDLPDQQVVLPQVDPETGTPVAYYVLGPALLTGKALETARSQLSAEGQWVVNPVFKEGADGIELFNAAAATCNSKATTCPNGQLAIVLDGRVISAPSINQPTYSRDQIEISGGFTEKEARELATVLRYGALPVQLEMASSNTVSATLGKDALYAGLVAGAIGFVLVTLYMVGFYRLLGAAAIAKLCVEGALLFSIIAAFGEWQGLALTLAGITGIIVSIGVSVDSNVVFYEHIKEDVRNGRTLRSAAERSFPGAWKTIVKADTASLIAAGLLYFLAVGPVRGFAFYLGLSTLLDLVASWFFMRPAVAALLQSESALSNPGRYGMPEPGVGRHEADAAPGGRRVTGAVGRMLSGVTDIAFARWWRRGLAVSGLVIVLSVASLATRGLSLTVDFTGGIAAEVSAPGVTAEQARDLVAGAGLTNTKVQLVGDDIIRVQSAADDEAAQQTLIDTLAGLAGGDANAVSVSTVSASWGDDITSQAMKALVFFLITILAYLTIRLELKMAVGAIVAVIHDIIVSVGVYSIFQFEVSPGTVIAFLTILGYSIYDTVVVYDKIKENEARAGLTGKLTYTDMVSLSMNQVLLRSLNTTVTSIIPVVSLLVIGAAALGAVALGQFAIALFVGLLTGAYSSVMVATPVVATLKEREPHYRALREKLAPASGRRRGEHRVGDGSVEGGEGDLVATRPTAGRTGVAAGPVAHPSPNGAIPPRPRRQGKKR